MKKVNFIASLSPEKQYEIRRWFWTSFFIMCCTITIGIIYLLPHIITYVTIKKELRLLHKKTKMYDNTELQRKTVTAEYESIHPRSTKINRYNEHPKTLLPHIAAITQAAGNNAQLESIVFNKKVCEMTMLYPTAEHATIFISRLSTSDKLFTQITLVSLQHENQTQQFKCIIKGNIII